MGKNEKENREILKNLVKADMEVVFETGATDDELDSYVDDLTAEELIQILAQYDIL